MAELSRVSPELTELRELLERRDFAALKAKLHRCDPRTLAKSWSGFKPMEKAVLFKLFEPSTAMDFYRGLDADEKYFLLGAFEIGCIAPVLEDLTPPVRSLFRRLPQEYFGEMSRQLS